MAPKYSASLRGPLPILLISFQTFFILIFLFLVSHNYNYEEKYLQRYPAFQDVNVLIIFGFGFFFVFLRRFGFSGVGFNLLIAAFGLQLSVILDAFLFGPKNGARVVGLKSLCRGLMSVVPVLISSGAVLGKMNSIQLIVMTAIEMSAFTANRYIMTKYLMMGEHISMMHTHIFGAFYGLAVSWTISLPSVNNEFNKEKEKSEKTSELFSMLGTLFMWMFWPSYNSALLQDYVQIRNAICNTYFTLAVSTVTVFSFSSLFNRNGKLEMVHVRNAVLAGGVSTGFTAFMVQYPWITMTIGLIAGLISTLSLKYFQRTLDKVSLLHDTCGVLYTFGFPGLIGGVSYSIIIITADYNGIDILGYQAIVGVGSIFLTLAISMVSGIVTGLLLKCKLWRPPKEFHFFQDQPFWELSHLTSHL
ncbi:blood group Rh(D) polypeptide-like [Spea bombifrons]|uniref:blood group Rh(D) polypeptide-like n=1 Tax=Spea bombifrons TaxID=233779 RepID=UPI00234A2C84|nr:blood group Rh(D) polypeptide-like [Spea bombifrons]